MAKLHRAGHRPDRVVQGTHAVLALAFMGAWLTAAWGGLRGWHVGFGCLAAMALAVRLAWSWVRPRASLHRWTRLVKGAARRMRAGHTGPLGLAARSLGGLAAVVCAMLALLPLCVSTGACLHWWPDVAPGSLVGLHEFLGTALMGVVATHLALIVCLSVMRDRCLACGMLGRWQTSARQAGVRSGHGDA